MTLSDGILDCPTGKWYRFYRAPKRLLHGSLKGDARWLYVMAQSKARYDARDDSLTKLNAEAPLFGSGVLGVYTGAVMFCRPQTCACGQIHGGSEELIYVRARTADDLVAVGRNLDARYNQ